MTEKAIFIWVMIFVCIVALFRHHSTNYRLNFFVTVAACLVIFFLLHNYYNFWNGGFDGTIQAGH